MLGVGGFGRILYSWEGHLNPHSFIRSGTLSECSFGIQLSICPQACRVLCLHSHANTCPYSSLITHHSSLLFNKICYSRNTFQIHLVRILPIHSFLDQFFFSFGNNIYRFLPFSWRMTNRIKILFWIPFLKTWLIFQQNYGQWFTS